MFTAWYAQIPYVPQIRFAFTGLTSRWTAEWSDSHSDRFSPGKLPPFTIVCETLDLVWALCMGRKFLVSSGDCIAIPWPSARSCVDCDIQPAVYLYTFQIQSGPKKCIHSLLINIFGINLNEISIPG